MSHVEPPMPPGYRVEMVTEDGPPFHDRVIDLWRRERAVRVADEARRVQEVLFVGVHDRDGVVGESSAYLARHAGLGLDLWFGRVFTSREHRMSNIAVVLSMRARDHLERRYVEGVDTRAGGYCVEVENMGLRTLDAAVWQPMGMPFVGLNERGDHVRVRYFPGALAPGPPG